MSTINILDNSDLLNLQDLSEDTINMIKEKIGYKRYGVRINKFEPDPYNRVEYIYDAVGMRPAHMNYTADTFDYGDWSELWFIKENYPVMLNPDGTIHQYLNPNDYSKTVDGKDSDVANVECEANAMSRIPLVYVHLSEDDKYEYLIVSKYQYDETYIPIAHMREDGSVVEECFMSMLDSAIIDEKIRSLSGQNPLNEKYFYPDYIDYARKYGERWNPWTYGQYLLLSVLMTIIGKSDNSQEVFGWGYTRDSIIAENVQTNGKLNNKGQFYGKNEGKTFMKAFHIENFYGHTGKILVGLRSDNCQYRVSFTGPYNIDGEGYKNTGAIFNLDLINGAEYQWVANTKCCKYGRFPLLSSEGGSNSTYICDLLWVGKITEGSEGTGLISGIGGHLGSWDGAGIWSYSVGKPYEMITPDLKFAPSLSYV